MPKEIREAGPFGAVRETSSGRIQVGLITPGWGSSGYYSQQVLENAAAAKVFPAGTQMFLDHPGETERYDRPERSVRDLAAVLTTDAVWDGNALVGEAQVFGPFIDTLTDEHFAKAIGVSIRAAAEVTAGEAEGRKGTLVTELVEAQSVDFVTRAGRGGSILAVLESARPAQVLERAIAHGVAEASANDTRDALMDALKGAYGAEKTWVWVRDFDETTVWFDLETPDEQSVYQQGYTLDDQGGAVLVDGDPLEVRARTEYVPVTIAAESGLVIRLTGSLDPVSVARQVEAALAQHRTPKNAPAPAGQSTATESKETTMATTQIEEAELGRLRQDAERAQTLESERDTARGELATFKAREAARPAVTKKVGESATLPPSRKARVVESVLKQVRVDENGAANAEELVRITESEVTEAETELAELAEALGHGRVTGFGQVHESTGASVEDFDAAFSTSQEG
ncbi:hypothetical protein [Phycicoccus avicenniae]|uniref:hypothetical protein n=1 Tax=Phycicoccus avicenniae TaxID=2828860 RepID=UPI003D2859EA